MSNNLQSLIYLPYVEGKRNFVVICKDLGGFFSIKHLCYTESEIDERVGDYYDQNAISALEVGQSYDIAGDKDCTIIRIS